MLYSDHDVWQKQVEKVIAHQWERMGDHKTVAIEMEEMRERRLSDDQRQAVERFIQRFFDFIWQDGPRIEQAIKRLYIITQEFSPDHVLRMNGTQIGVMVNDTRQTINARKHVVIRQFEEVTGEKVRRTQLYKHRSEAVKREFSEQRKGNHNRLGGKSYERKYATF